MYSFKKEKNAYKVKSATSLKDIINIINKKNSKTIIFTIKNSNT